MDNDNDDDVGQVRVLVVVLLAYTLNDGLAFGTEQSKRAVDDLTSAINCERFSERRATMMLFRIAENAFAYNASVHDVLYNLSAWC